ncbi:MAG: phage terminase large subunit [Paenibacillus dendritiformis]|uniref:phage terminase large subunit n=1 Tax=uncultured Paenibacillus sp. TaxID=227322 RepID=UPI0025ED52E6|nr:phage terminase large subunit [uncultured Paenibacillus sp.]MDU5141075.1 phage terminase large subunit [Paenibacillus dendritiformis]
MSIINDFRKNTDEQKRKKIIEHGRTNFREYCNRMNPSFFKPHRTYQDHLCNTLQAAYEKKLINPDTGKPYDIIIINLPPGFGKSYTGIMFATWAYGQDIRNQIVEVSYNQTLAETFSKAVREAIRDEEIEGDMSHFVVNSFFPKLKIKAGDGAMTRWALEGSYMSYLASGFDGTLTGMRGNIGIIDDPIKNAAEAVNERVKEGHFNFYKNTFTSRMLDGALQIIIQTRWATDDLAGRLLTEFPQRCYEIRLPALTEDGRSLCEDLYSTEDLLQKKATLDEHIWLANFMQEPIDIRGGLYANGFNTYDAVDDTAFERVIAYGDTADEGEDDLCVISAGVIDKYAYVLDVYFTGDAMEITEPETARRLDLHDVREAAIESNNGGRGFARNVAGELRRLKNRKCQVTWFTQSKNKRTRILVNASNVLEQVIFPEGWEKKWPAFYKALMKYQRKGKNAHDDAPDALTGLVELVNGDVKLKRKARVGSRRRLGL